MSTPIWIAVFLISLFFLVRGSDIFIDKAEYFGVRIGMPTFVVGVLIVGIGTSLPELASGVAGVLSGAYDIAPANAIGSNIANMLLVVGIVSVIGGKLLITKNLIDAELPFFTISTLLFLGVVYDGTVTMLEALLLFTTYLIYLGYLFTTKEDIDTLVTAKQKEVEKEYGGGKNHYLRAATVGIFGLAGLLGGAHYLVRSVLVLASDFGVAPGLISVSAIAIGTSLPEVSVSLRALQRKNIDLAVGNIFGSNAFNILLAVGIPGLLATLHVDPQTYAIGIPILAAVTFIFLIIGLARVIYRWEGLMFLVFYLFFLFKLFGI